MISKLSTVHLVLCCGLIIAQTSAQVCDPPNANTVGLTIDEVVNDINGFVNQTATAHCSNCTQSKRNFYTTASTNNLNDALGNAQAALTIQCPTTDYCICGSGNVCCSPLSDAAAPTQVQLIPYCNAAGGCQMNAVNEQGTATSLTCTNGQVYDDARQLTSTGNYRLLNSGAYFNAQRVSCRGCQNIQEDLCSGPTKTGTA